MERNDEDKSSIICYEYNKPEHFKPECLELEKFHDKEYYKSKEKKGLMSTQEDLDGSLSDEEEEEANLCLMVDTNS